MVWVTLKSLSVALVQIKHKFFFFYTPVIITRSHIFMSKEKYDSQVSKSPKSSVPVGMVILYFLFVVDRGIHP